MLATTGVGLVLALASSALEAFFPFCTGFSKIGDTKSDGNNMF